MKQSVTAIVPAAGLGKRFGSGTNKPFHKLLEKPLIVWSLELFERIDEIEEVIPVLKGPDMNAGVEIFEQYSLSKVKRIAPGGAERQDSVYSGLKLIKKQDNLVLIHDGARPLIDEDTVVAAISSVSGFDGAVVGVPVKDTIKEAEAGFIKNTLKREVLWAIQTPQVFRYGSIMKAYNKAMEDRFYSTDDAALIEHAGGKVKIVMGSYTNIKITTPEDIKVAEFLMDRRRGSA